MAREIQQRKDYLKGEVVETIYFGGGTPSLLNEQELHSLFGTLREHFDIDPHAEITLEANPDDLSKEKLETFKSFGINRLSIGIQSFHEDDLRLMNRAHRAHESHQAIQLAKTTGFDNITIDLMYGLPYGNGAFWEQNIRTVIDYNIPHISCYTLMVEEKTKLHHDLKTGKIKLPDEKEVEQQFMLLRKKLLPKYTHYEISNFCLPGHESKHNSAYWAGKNYLGIGPGAHSFDGKSRQWNIRNNPQYIKAMEDNTLFYEEEILTRENKFNELVLTGIRTAKGIALNKLSTVASEDELSSFLKKVAVYEQRKLLKKEKEHVFLTEDAVLISDHIAGDLFI